MKMDTRITASLAHLEYHSAFNKYITPDAIYEILQAMPVVDKVWALMSVCTSTWMKSFGSRTYFIEESQLDDSGMRDQHEPLPLTGKEDDTDRSENYIEIGGVCITTTTEFAGDST
ncbi:unnamed protein product [Ilex paraguariensis]|uniref:Uncharacterized protein n=1 Tax=Ilex paraguariensis TaxID=185542 RepID=A0ABC8S3Z4_9AQUA